MHKKDLTKSFDSHRGQGGHRTYERKEPLFRELCDLCGKLG